MPSGFLPVLLEVFARLLGHHMQQVDAGLSAGGDVAQHAHHLLHMTLAGIGDQKIAEHRTGPALRQPMADGWADSAPWCRP